MNALSARQMTPQPTQAPGLPGATGHLTRPVTFESRRPLPLVARPVAAEVAGHAHR